MKKESIIAIIANMEEECRQVKQMLVELNSCEGSNLPSEQPNEQDVDDVILGCQIITSIKDFYEGKCHTLRIQKRFVDHGMPKVYLDKNRVVITALDHEGREIGSTTVAWGNLCKYQLELIKRGINKHDQETWVPKIVELKVN